MTHPHARTTVETVNNQVPTIEPAVGARLIPGWMRRLPPIVQDTVLALVLAATLVKDLASQQLPADAPMRDADPMGYVLVALLVLPLALRRRYPLATFAAILLDAVLVTALFYRPTSFGFGLIVATYTVARWCRADLSLVALVLAQGFAAFVKLRAIEAGLDIGWFEWPLDAVYMGGAWFLGRSIRQQHDYATALEHSRELLAKRAVQDERTRIARELHDAVGHSISVMTLHIGAAQELLSKNPSRAAEALASAGDVGRSAMAEMDQTLGLLRSDDPELSDLLRPSLANLDALIAEFRDIGLTIEPNIDETPEHDLPTAVDQSAFRIIQEALTNTVKHAGLTRASVDVHRSESCLELEVRDHGEHRPPSLRPAPGHQSQGILGMQERVAMLDGQLEVGPMSSGGFRVAAKLPLTRQRP